MSHDQVKFPVTKLNIEKESHIIKGEIWWQLIFNILNGKIKSSQYYTNGFYDKDWVFYYSNGKLRTKAYFKRDLRVEDWHFYSKNGNLWEIQKYDSLGRIKENWKTYDTLKPNSTIDNWF